MKRNQRLVLKDKTGFRNINGTPVVILDSRGVIFYDTRVLEDIVWEFNLPAGEYYLERGKISEMAEPVQYDLMPMPKPERNRQGDPTLFKIQFANNPNKCTIDWKKRSITFDESMRDWPLPTMVFILYHEHAHKYYETEAICDRYAANKMLDAGYNQSQIGEAILSLSDKQYPRKEYLIESLLGSADHYDECINEDTEYADAQNVSGSADKFVGGQLIAKYPVTVYSSPNGNVIKTVKPGDVVGFIYSWVERDGKIFWQLQDNSFVEHKSGVFDTDALAQSLIALEREREAKIKAAAEERIENNKPLAAITNIMDTLKWVFIAGAIIAVVKLVKS